MRLGRVVAAVALLAIAAPALPSAPARASSCISASGPFVSALETGDHCPGSPLSMCTHGRLTGDLEANYDFTFFDVTPDPDDPARTNYTGESVLTFADGACMYSHDTGYFLAGASGASQFETTVDITGGTKRYLGASGQIVARGALDPASGATVGSYTASICVDGPNGGCSVD